MVDESDGARKVSVERTVCEVVSEEVVEANWERKPGVDGEGWMPQACYFSWSVVEVPGYRLL